MKVACALITHLRVKAELKRQPHLEDLPTIIVDRSQTRPLVIDSSPKAPAVAIGTTLEQALSHQPNAIVVEADDPHYRRVFQQVLTTLLGVSDRVEAAELGTVYVGIDGLEPMYGGEARLVTTLLNAVPRWLNPRIGVGEGKFPALVATRTSRALGATRVPPDAATFLSPHSVDLLPVSAGTREALHRFGLHTLGQIAVMKSDLLVDRFGREGWQAWALANGNDDSPLGAHQARGNCDGADLAALFLNLPGVGAGGGGYPASPGLLAPGDTGPVCRPGHPGMRRLPLSSLAENHCLPGRSQLLGAGFLHSPQPTGGRAPGCSHRRPDPDPG